jgi:uncharacterized membrane protein
MSRRRYRDRSAGEPNVGWRDRLPFRRPERYFQWRGQHVSRLEGLSDAVFGFALTLLVVASEVPRTFDGLARVLRDFPAFVACFALLMLFWNEHYRFFRRYGLEDWLTRCLNYVILLLVLFSVYPLKFLFSSWFSGWFGGSMDDSFSTPSQLRFVYRIYGGGFACIWAAYALLTWHALRLRDSLRLNAVEVVLTKLELNGFLINIGVCLLSIGLTFTNVHLAVPGLIYSLLGPLLAANGFWHGAKVTRLVERESTPPLAA